MPVVSPFVAALPKVELHLHLVGSASPATVLELSRRHPEVGVPTEPDALAAFYAFRDFAHFITVYDAVNLLVRTGDDLVALITGLAADAAASNVRYAEVTVTPRAHERAGIPADEIADALRIGRELARSEHGLALNWIIDVPAECGQDYAWRTLEFALQHRPAGLVGFGLAGMEVGPPREAYRPQFDAARAAGLHSIVHAGEVTGPETVWAALRELRAERIGHGLGAAADPALLDHLRDNGIPVEVCPTSNLCTRAVNRIEEHPLPLLLEHGIAVTLSTDDPGMFATSLNAEYALAAEAFGLSDAQLADIARTGVRAALCEETLRAELLAAIG